MNILFIAVDDMNDWIGPLGGLDVAKTPHLDQLASMSMTFTNAHCSSPVCSPSRLSLMTGIEPAKTGKIKNEWYDGPKWREVEDYARIETLGQFFKNRGYKTLAGGKIYHTLAPPWKTINHADPSAWDYYFPSVQVPLPYQKRAAREVIDPQEFMGKRHSYFTWGPLDLKDEKMADHQVVDWALHELNKDFNQPIFLAVGLFRPHMPWEVPKKYFDMYPLEEIPDLKIKDNDLEDAIDHGRRSWHRFVLENDQWKKVIQAYLACLTFTDAQIGRLLDGVKNSGYADNTIIVLWSDHGMHLGEKENWEKFTLWEESTRVPLLFKVPGITKPGTRSHQPVSLLDIYPTLAALTGNPIPAHCDGVSLKPQLTDGQKSRDRSAMTSLEFRSGLIGHSLRSADYRYISYPALGFEELYNHEEDPNEFKNIAYNPSYISILEKFRNELTARVPGITKERITNLSSQFEVRNDSILNLDYKKLYELPFKKTHIPIKLTP